MESKLLTEYEFKGKRLEPFSKGRLSLAAAAGIRMTGDPSPSIKDVLGIIFLCMCDFRVRSLAQTDPAAFWQKEEEWEEAQNVAPEDFSSAAELVNKLLQHATATKAEPIDSGDLSQLPDPNPNALSLTI